MPANPNKPPRVRSCGAVTEFHRLAERDPRYRTRLARIEQTTQRSIARMRIAELSAITIPIVVHVVYKTAAENISDQQIQSQFAVLNADYNATNADIQNVPAPWKSLASNAKIQFKLASVDPDGKAANGIIRTKTDISSFAQDETVKSTADGGSDAWDT